MTKEGHTVDEVNQELVSLSQHDGLNLGLAEDAVKILWDVVFLLSSECKLREYNGRVGSAHEEGEVVIESSHLVMMNWVVWVSRGGFYVYF